MRHVKLNLIFSSRKYVLLLLATFGLLLILFNNSIFKSAFTTLKEEITCVRYEVFGYDSKSTIELNQLIRAANHPSTLLSKVDIFPGNEDVPISSMLPLKLGKLKTINGFAKIFVYDEKDYYISGGILRSNDWEPEIRHTMQHLLIKNSHLQFIDVGSNVGVFSLTAANLGRTVLAVDANVENLKRLWLSAKINNFRDKILLVNNALAELPGSAQIGYNLENVGGASLSTANNTKYRSIVKIIRFDQILNLISFKSAIMKIDIEGFEHKALAGATKIFEKIHLPYIFMEWATQRAQMRINGAGAIAFLLNFFKQHKYTAHSISFVPLENSWHCHWPNDILWIKSNHNSL